jgi:hypothetical protein
MKYNQKFSVLPGQVNTWNDKFFSVLQQMHLKNCKPKIKHYIFFSTSIQSKPK